MSRIDIESTERMIKSLTIFNMTQEEMTKALNEVETTMNKSSVEVTNLITKLQLIKGHLYDIKDVRLDE